MFNWSNSKRNLFNYFVFLRSKCVFVFLRSAAGRTGALAAALIYVLIIHFIHSNASGHFITQNFFTQQCNYTAQKHFGFGRSVLFSTFIQFGMQSRTNVTRKQHFIRVDRQRGEQLIIVFSCFYRVTFTNVRAHCVASNTKQNLPLSGLNPAIKKLRKLNFFQTVNNARVLWDPRAKPKGLLGGTPEYS